MNLRNIMLAFCLVTGFFLSANIAGADEASDAKALYFAAEDAYEAKDYDAALSGIEAVEKLLGQSNALLQALRVKVLFETGHSAGTRKALDEFHSFKANDILTREIAPYLARMEKQGEAIETTIANAGYDGAQDVARLPDGGFVIAGYRYSNDIARRSARVLRFNRRGEMLWERSISGATHISSFAVAALPNGGFVIAGNVDTETPGSNDGWIAAMDDQGNLLWTNRFGDWAYDSFDDVAVLPDGGFLIAGLTNSYDSDAYNAWALRLDDRGGVLWEQVLGGEEHDGANSIITLPDGGVVFAGYTEINPDKYADGGNGISAPWIVKLDQAGEYLWEKSFGGEGRGFAKSIIALPDGGFVVAGASDVNGDGFNDAWVSKLSQNGGLIWQQTYGGTQNDAANSIISLPDGGFVVAGQTQSQGAGAYDAWVFQIDDNGALLWEKTFGGQGDDTAKSVAVLPGGRLAVVGDTTPDGTEAKDLWYVLIQP